MPLLDGRTLAPTGGTGTARYGSQDPSRPDGTGWFQLAVNQAVDEWNQSEGMDKAQAILGAVGFIPYVGVLADLVNSGIYAARGKGVEASISFISAVPGLGDAVGLAYKAAKGIKASAKVIGTTFKQVTKGVGMAAGQNFAEQTARIHYGRQESYEWEQMLGAAVSGGALGPIAVGGGQLAGAVGIVRQANGISCGRKRRRRGTR